MLCSTSTLVTFLATAAVLMDTAQALPTRRASSPRARRSNRDTSISLSGRAKRTTEGDFPVENGAGIKNSTINLTVISKRSPRSVEGNVFSRIVRSLLRGQDQVTAEPVVTFKPVRKSLVVAELSMPAVKAAVVSSSSPVAKSSAVVAPPVSRFSAAAHARRLAALEKKRVLAARQIYKAEVLQRKTVETTAAQRTKVIASKAVERARILEARRAHREQAQAQAPAQVDTTLASPSPAPAPVVVKRARSTLINPKSKRHSASRSAAAEYAAGTGGASSFTKVKRRVVIAESS